MPLYLLKYQLWKYKFQKLSYTLEGFWAYLGICVWVLIQKIKKPNGFFVGILLAEHLGDIVAAEPIVPALKKKFPNATLCWIAKDRFHMLLENNPGIDKIFSEKNIFSSTLLGKANPFNALYNLHINGIRKDPFYHTYFFNPRSASLNITVENYYNNRNLLQIFSQFAELDLHTEQPVLHLKDKSVKLPFEGPYWVIHTKSNQTSREWLDEKWEQLVPKMLDSLPINIIEIGVSNGISSQHPKFHSMVGKLSLPETVYVMKNASFFMGIDSGPSHIANALQLPGLLILGRYENFNPYLPFSGAYQEGTIAKLYFNENNTAAEHSVDEIWHAVQETYLKSSAQLVK